MNDVETTAPDRFVNAMNGIKTALEVGGMKTALEVGGMKAALKVNGMKTALKANGFSRFIAAAAVAMAFFAPLVYFIPVIPILTGTRVAAWVPTAPFVVSNDVYAEVTRKWFSNKLTGSDATQQIVKQLCSELSTSFALAKSTCETSASFFKRVPAKGAFGYLANQFVSKAVFGDEHSDPVMLFSFFTRLYKLDKADALKEASKGLLFSEVKERKCDLIKTRYLKSAKVVQAEDPVSVYQVLRLETEYAILKEHSKCD